MNTYSSERLETRIGLATIGRMSRAQAYQYGMRNMPVDLKRCGFDCKIYRARMDINGWDGYRISYGK